VLNSVARPLSKAIRNSAPTGPIPCSYVWDMNFDSDTNVVEVAVRRLRAKVDDPFAQKIIHTVRGMGYVLDIEKP
jgi:hypothetical protein